MLGAVALLLVGTAALAFGGAAGNRALRAAANGRSPLPRNGAALLGVRPELFVVVAVAAWVDQPSIAAGAALGWSVFVGCVGFGAGALVARRPVPSPSRLLTLLPGGALVLGAFALSDQVLTRLEGVVLLSGFLLFVAILVQDATVAGEPARPPPDGVSRGVPGRVSRTTATMAALALALLAVGAIALVRGARGVSDHSGLSPGFVGAAIAGALAAGDAVLFQVSTISGGRGELAAGELLVGLTASSIGALGLAAVVRPLLVDSAAASAYPAATLVFTIVATSLLTTGRAGRVAAICLFGLYAGWLAFAARL